MIAGVDIDRPAKAPAWIRVWLGAVTALAKTEERAGRRVVTRLVLAGPEIDSGVLKRLPIGRIEAYANADRTADHDRRRDTLTAAIEALLLSDDVHALDDLSDGEPPTRPPLTRPDGTDPDGFYRRVAAAYQEAVLATPSPAPVLATEAGVPVATARNWIQEARRRGFLPPARRGRAG